MDETLGRRLDAAVSDDFSPQQIRGRVSTGLELAGDDAELRDRLPDDRDVLVVTGTGPVRELFDGLGAFDGATIVTAEEPTQAEVRALRDRVDHDGGPVVGFGGGSIIDVAKQAAAEMGRSFVAVPTAGSHDGAFSSRASLYASTGTGVRQSTDARAADRVIVPLHHWEEAPYRLWAAGQFDVLANLTALQDCSLARLRGARRDGSRLHRDCSTHAVRCLLDYMEEGKTEQLADALFFSGVSMRSSHGSVYASGFEHELERYIRDINGVDVLHGTTVGLSMLVSAYLYREHMSGVDGLLFDPGRLYDHVRDGVRAVTADRETGFGPIVDAVEGNDAGLEAISGLRERYTLRRELDLEEIDLASVCRSVLADL